MRAAVWLCALVRTHPPARRSLCTASFAMPPRRSARNKRPAVQQQQEEDVVGKKKKASPSRISLGKEPTVHDLQQGIVANLHQHATPATKDWFTNYVKGTTWIGCKLPTVRQCVHDIIPPIKSLKRTKTPQAAPALPAPVLLDTAVQLLQQAECDVKLAGMLILSECFPVEQDGLASTVVLDRLEQDVLQANHITDWSSADWIAMKVLRKIVLEASAEMSPLVVPRILDYTRQGTSLWYRRCGIIPFCHYHKHRDVLPDDIGARVLQACEASLLASPAERFTQTGVAWVLRYRLSRETATEEEREAAAAMIVAHGSLWTTEAKKSLTEKLAKSDPLWTKIRNL